MCKNQPEMHSIFRYVGKVDINETTLRPVIELGWASEP